MFKMRANQVAKGAERKNVCVRNEKEGKEREKHLPKCGCRACQVNSPFKCFIRVRMIP